MDIITDWSYAAMIISQLSCNCDRPRALALLSATTIKPVVYQQAIDRLWTDPSLSAISCYSLLANYIGVWHV